MGIDTPIQVTIKAKGCEASGESTDNGFLVHTGSTLRRETVDSAPKTLIPQRKKLIAAGVIEEKDGLLRFAQDHLFDTPSGAAAMVMGRTANGWIEWKTSDGTTLGKIKHGNGEHVLGPERTRQILDRYNRLFTDGKLLTNGQIEQYTSAFRERFHPDSLSKMDDETLIELYNFGNHDSLVYWLEFKHDDEFQTRAFGSIAGGAAHKFGVFFSKEKGTWQSRDQSNNSCEIAMPQAIEIAIRNREQLTLGIQLLEEFPVNGSDDEYARLQSQMDELAPDVSNLAWGHKYFSLFYPDKLDNYHVSYLQRFHLMKLLQFPPEGEGRYLCAGRFTSGTRETGLSMYHFTSTLNHINGARHHYWRVGTHGGKTDISYWEMMRERNCIAIGWKELGDISWVEANKKSRERLKALLMEKYPNKNAKSAGNNGSQITHYIATMKRGDIVAAADGKKILGLGRVTGDYTYEPKFDFPHHRSVEWLDLGEWKFPHTEGLMSTVRELKKYNENILEIERRVQAGRIPPPPPPHHFQGIPGRIQSILKRKGQVILYGPPGTGKTYWAEKAAMDLAAVSTFGHLFGDLNESDKKTVAGNGESPGLVRWCCFHPAYGYEDFLEGYRPSVQDGQVFFEIRDGVFKKLCYDAEKKPDRNFYLIVDEINRGDIPRIFGELLTVLEKDKRGKQLVLPVSQESFSVPNNVFLIGTMNTADRSISLLDAALRRRFGFIELMPDSSVLRDIVVKGVPLRGWFEALNKRIREHVGRDARNLQIGHSYLMTSSVPIVNFNALKRAIRDDIIPLIEEYCYEDFATLQKILGNGLVDSEKQVVLRELFEEDQEENLVQALLEPCPDIATSSEALSSEEDADDVDNSEDEEELAEESP